MTLTCSCEEEFPEPLFSNSVIRGNIDFFYSNDEAPENITISALGPYEKKKALTNSTGDFQINGLGNGTYNLEISKEGYGSKYQYGIQLFGNDTVGVRDELYQRVTDKLPTLYEIHTQDSYSWLSEKKIVITTSRNKGEIPCRVFMSEDENVSYKNFQWTSEPRTVKRNGFDKLLLFIDNIPYESWKTVYLRVYICNPEEHYGYFNKNTGLLTFSTLEEDERSSVMSFTMP